MWLPLIALLLILATIIFMRLRQNQGEKPEKQESKKEEKEPSVGRDNNKFKPTDVVKVSAAGAIFLALLYALVPEFVVKNHKEVIILVVAMVVGAMLLGVKEEWEKSSARKILKAHFVILSIVLISILLYKEFEIGKWVRVQSSSARTVEFNLYPGEKMQYSVPPRHSFRIYSDDRVEAKTWDGRIYRDKDTAWLGDEIRHANFVLRSAEETKTARVVITLRPK